jgi:hypothetical protein
LFPKGTVTPNDVKQLINEAWDSTIKGLENILSYRPFEEEASSTVDLNELKNLIASLEEKTKRISYLLVQAQKDPTKTAEYFLEATQLGCEMFRQVLDNPVFLDGIKWLPWARSQHEVEFIKMIEDFSGKLQDFVQKELDVLIRYNVSVPDTLLKEGLTVLENIRQGENAPRTPIKKSLEILRDETCKLYVTLDENTPDERKRKLVIRVLIEAVMAGSACIVAIVNVIAEQDGTLTLAEAALSGHIAAAIIGATATNVMNFTPTLAGYARRLDKTFDQ